MNESASNIAVWFSVNWSGRLCLIESFRCSNVLRSHTGNDGSVRRSASASDLSADLPEKKEASSPAGAPGMGGDFDY